MNLAVCFVAFVSWTGLGVMRVEGKSGDVPYDPYACDGWTNDDMALGSYGVAGKIDFDRFRVKVYWDGGGDASFKCYNQYHFYCISQ